MDDNCHLPPIQFINISLFWPICSCFCIWFLETYSNWKAIWSVSINCGDTCHLLKLNCSTMKTKPESSIYWQKSILLNDENETWTYIGRSPPTKQTFCRFWNRSLNKFPILTDLFFFLPNYLLVCLIWTNICINSGKSYIYRTLRYSDTQRVFKFSH